MSKCSCEAADLLFGLGEHRGIGAFVGDDVADAQAPAWLEYAECLGKYARLVAGQVDDAVGDDYVDVIIRERDALDLAPHEARVSDLRLLGVGAGKGEHVG